MSVLSQEQVVDLINSLQIIIEEQGQMLYNQNADYKLLKEKVRLLEQAVRYNSHRE